MIARASQLRAADVRPVRVHESRDEPLPEESIREKEKLRRRAFLSPFGDLLDYVDAVRDGGIYPFFSRIEAPVEGARPIVLAANDYLGLSKDGRVRNAARDAIARLGTSRCASPLAGGFTALHDELEREIATFLGQEEATTFASGYQANVGILSALMGPNDLIVTDLLDHASIIDGARLSGAQLRFFRHDDPAHLAKVLEQNRGKRRALVVVEGIYSADGDVVSLREICAAAHAHGALVMIDEAHSLGVLGSGGRGAAEHHGCLDEVDLIMGTMSKSLASVGGFVAADARLVEVIRHRARALIFSAAVPPASVAAALESLRILQEEPERRRRLWHNARHLASGLRERGFDTMGSETPVIPVRIGDPGLTLELASRLRDRGVLVCPAIPPMVRGKLSRIRLHVTAAHDTAALDEALRAITDVGSSLGLPHAQGHDRQRSPIEAPLGEVAPHETVG